MSDGGLALLDRGAALAEAGRPAEAVRLFRSALASEASHDNDPELALAAHRNLGHVLSELQVLHPMRRSDFELFLIRL